MTDMVMARVCGELEARNRRLRAAMHEAIDLLAERKYGNHARSAGHNARLCLEAAIVDEDKTQ